MKEGCKPLPRSFYSPSAKLVAPALLGHLLFRRSREGVRAGAIVETEAYLHDDPACHAAPGLTPRNRVMFGEAGFAYVYFIYGCHFCVNAVCGPAGVGEAVLIRALQPIEGEALMRRARPNYHGASLTNGPGKLCQALSLARGLNGVDLCDPASDLLILQNPGASDFVQAHGGISATARIGITRAAKSPLRFLLPKNQFISRCIRPGTGE
jgi:DNA-3-methyladenine glycosylase